MTKPLLDRRILITRPKARTDELSRRLTALGARISLAPAVKTLPPSSWKPLDRALARLDGFDAAVFASRNAVEGFFQRARKTLGRRPPRPSRVLAVGPGTAHALESEGWPDVEVPDSHCGAGLARALGRARGMKVLLPRAERAPRELPRLLRLAGASVHAVPAYRTVPDLDGLRSARRAVLRGDIDWVVFASPSAVRAFFDALPPDHLKAFFAKARAASIGPSTSAALRERGVSPAAEPAEAAPAALAAAMARRTRLEPVASLEKTLKLALGEAGKALRRNFGKVTLKYKGRADIVTEADYESEERILRVILERFPDHDYMTEERPPRLGGSEYVWIIDPLDGTVNYAHGFPASSVSIALLHRGRPLVAGVYDPFRDEMFLASRGRGATLNGRPLRVSRVRRLDEALLVTGFAYDRYEKGDYYLRFFRSFMGICHDLRRMGSAALDLAWIAAGRVDGYWEFHLRPWDVAAGWLLVEEAGGKITDFDGRPWTYPSKLGAQTLAANGRIHEQMLRRIRKEL